MKKFTIGDIENLTGIKAHTIRVWETRYQLLQAKRTGTNIRYYDDDDLRFFLNVAGLLNHGHKISKIAKMERGQIEVAVANLRSENSNHALQVQNLISATLTLNNHHLNTVLDECIAQLGIVDAVTQVFFPFMHKIGQMWQIGSINPAHEHFASNLIRQKIIAAINQLPDKATHDSKRFMLFLPQDETHDIGLLLAQYLLKNAGHHVLYLGQNMPYNDLFATASYYQPHYAVAAVSLTHNLEAEKLIQLLLDSLPHWQLVISGAIAFNPVVQQNKKLITVKDFANFMELVQ